MYPNYYSYLANLSAGLIVLFIIIAALLIVANWKIFEKAGVPGWGSLIPIYNAYLLYKITWGNGWFFLLNLLAIIPVVGPIVVFVITIITDYKLAQVFGQGAGFTVGLVLLPNIFTMILGFGDYRYEGVYYDNPYQQ
ncbi:MAG: DUF5684 domain-containing protein [Pseudoramibacter sp.]